MASKKKKRNNAENKRVKSTKNRVDIEKKNIIDSDTEECEKILEQLDEMERKNNMSSRVKSLIREDKEAIKKMNESIINKEDDELDYLDDEVELDLTGDKEELDDYRSDSYKKDIETGDTTEKDNKAEDGYGETAENIEKAFESDEEKEANLDFFANLNREDSIENERIRKKTPKRLINNANKLSFTDRIKLAARNNTKNFLVGTTIAFLLVVLLIALVIDAGNRNDDKDTTTKISGEFIETDTTPIIDVINNYYAALESGDIDVVRSLMADSENITDDEIKVKCDEAKAYSELVGSSFVVTDCYIQQGMKSGEYVVYFKFQVTIKSIKTPTVGVFTSYVVNEPVEDKSDLNYKICVGVNDKTSDIYRYILKMSSCKNVTDLFAEVDKELEEACEKDSDLKAIVDVLKGTEEETVNEETTEPFKENDKNDSNETKKNSK